MHEKSSVDQLDPRKNIIIKNARVHNLKNVSVAIPRNQFVVITGLSGSGKSSLAFDTLYAEGQRRYVESLSSYARQFLGRLDKPEVDYIKGISPAIAIEQKVVSRSSRSTVGTTTEVYDYLKLLFARVGKTISPVSGKEVKRHRVEDVQDAILNLEEGTKLLILAPLHRKSDRSLKDQLKILSQQGFVRIWHKGEVKRIEDGVEKEIGSKDEICIVIDRLIAKDTDENKARIADSTESAFFEGRGECVVQVMDEKNTKFSFSNRFELDGITFEEPSVHFFSFNNPVGACKTCEGFGSVIGIDEDLVIPNKGKSIYDDAVVAWKGDKMSAWKRELVLNAEKFDFPVHKPYRELSEEQRELVWTGNQYFGGLSAFFKMLEENAYKIQYRVMLSRYRGKTKCPDCKGTRLRKDAHYVKIDGSSIADLVKLPLSELTVFFENLSLNAHDHEVAKRLLTEIRSRLEYLNDVGLSYLTLNRESSTLSGGESQRINLATSLGSSLVGSMYILDEPSIGLHPRDTHRLIKVLKRLQNLGNTVIVVEHDEEIMKAADQLVDMGPLAGTGGGNLVFQGNHSKLNKAKDSLTAQYLTGSREIPIPSQTRKWKDKITISGASENNLKNLTVDFPLGIFTVVSGVSGSGKSTLVNDLFSPALQKRLGGYAHKTGSYGDLTGDIEVVKAVESVDQNPIGKSSRSNPVTYVKAFDEIRTLLSRTKLAKSRAYKPSHFSFNVPGGRCENCEGEGEVTIEMQFMADIKLQCEVCKGKRYQEDILEVKIGGKNVSDILDLTIDDAVRFFQDLDNDTKAVENLVKKISPLQEVGLGYLTLGQPSNTLSGGEAQRIKLASFLSRGDRGQHTLFIFDEPTTGLHFHDIQKLLDSFNALVEQGNTVIVIEHDPDVIKCADWVIDLGPDGGKAGGEVVFEGTPKDLTEIQNSFTAKFLAPKFEQTKVT
ncbi:excinuclease ABC subunit UvrA [Halocola ammonii]